MPEYTYTKTTACLCGNFDPFYIEDANLSEEAAMVVGKLRTTYDSLLTQLQTIARLTAPTVPPEEDHARELLEELISLKRTYMDL